MVRRNARFEVEQIEQLALIGLLSTHMNPSAAVNSSRRNHDSPIRPAVAVTPAGTIALYRRSLRQSGEAVMKAILLSGAAALVLLAAPAAAQNNTSKSVDPHQLAVESKKPPLKLDDAQREAIRNALLEEDTQQKTPKDFKPQVGALPPKGIKIDVMPQALGRQLPIMKEYGYAKTASDILVIDPMSQKIVDVIPRKFPADAGANATTPAEWWNSHARELTGQPPRSASESDHVPQPEGEAPAVGNGSAPNAQPAQASH
jgi:hypothetical protein